MQKLDMKEQELPDSKKKSNKLVFKFPTQYFIQAQYKKMWPPNTKNQTMYFIAYV